MTVANYADTAGNDMINDLRVIGFNSIDHEGVKRCMKEAFAANGARMKRSSTSTHIEMYVKNVAAIMSLMTIDTSLMTHSYPDGPGWAELSAPCPARQSPQANGNPFLVGVQRMLVEYKAELGGASIEKVALFNKKYSLQHGGDVWFPFMAIFLTRG
ncbi:hypothetical protein F5Y15DRAFT_415597 [Xylariaceae sp. FL0016]|nr:hypothetical protein F5Y15DRAFT_415597 [Xylariaceae sp. FL0016]